MSTRDGDSAEDSPRTVADLLAQYGDGSVPAGGRRRRRATDPDETAPQAIIDRVLSDSGSLRRLDEHGQPVSTPPPPADRPVRHAHAAPPAAPATPAQGPPPAAGPAASGTPAPAAAPPGAVGQSSAAGPAAAAPRRTATPARPQPPRMAPPAARGRVDEDPTEQFPRIEDAPARDAAAGYGAPSRRAEAPRRTRHQPEPDEPDWDDGPPRGRQPGPEDTAVTARHPIVTDSEPPLRPARGTQPPRRGAEADEDALLDDEHGDGFDPDRDTWDRDGRARDSRTRTGVRDTPHRDELDDLDGDPDDDAGHDLDRADDHDDADESPAKEWVVMASQLTVGAIGGAALWLGFQWLWQTMPVLALIVALVVITALVWVVRRIRHSDDLQTIVVTVLVGLFVTVSPAALLLLDR